MLGARLKLDPHRHLLRAYRERRVQPVFRSPWGSIPFVTSRSRGQLPRRGSFRVVSPVSSGILYTPPVVAPPPPGTAASLAQASVAPDTTLNAAGWTLWTVRPAAGEPNVAKAEGGAGGAAKS